MNELGFYDRIMIIGCFNLDFSPNAANSVAANQVQIEIIDNICKTFTESDVIVSANKPQRTWPYSQFLKRGQVVGKYKFHGYLNILFLKDIIIYFRHLLLILTFKPAVVFKYNTTLFESLFLFFGKKIFRFKVVLFIQDVSNQGKGSSLIKKVSEIMAIKIASNFDILVPITNDILIDFKLKKEKSFVFQGGLTSQARLLISKSFDFISNKDSKHFVFAGALEEYNGIKEIVDYWVNNIVDFNLHIYGKGTYEDYVIDCEKKVLNIKYFGFTPESVIISDQLTAFGNFCFRNSKGINQKYFFPSKFFNVLACPGRAFVNDFHNFPKTIKQNCYILKEDLSDFNQIINSHKEEENIQNYKIRIDWLKKYADWSFAIVEVKKRLDKK